MNNIFDNIPENIESEVHQTLATGRGVRMERIISRGHSSPEDDWYDQDDNEWIMILRGEAVILFDDGVSVRLSTGDYVDIPAHKKHRVEWTLPDVETIWLAVHY